MDYCNVRYFLQILLHTKMVLIMAKEHFLSQMINPKVNSGPRAVSAKMQMKMVLLKPLL